MQVGIAEPVQESTPFASYFDLTHLSLSVGRCSEREVSMCFVR